MGQIKNIKLHIVTDIKKDKMDESWVDALADGSQPPQQPQQQPLQPQQPAAEMSASEYLSQFLSGAEVDSIIDKLGATTMDDLKLVDKEIAEEAVADLKLIPRKKALEARMKAAAPATTTTPEATPVTTTSTPPETATNETE